MTGKNRSNSATYQKKLALPKALSLAVSITLLATSIRCATASVFFSSGFESGFAGWVIDTCCDYSLTQVSSPKRAGNYAARFELHKDDPDVQTSRRSELGTTPVPVNSDFTYQFSIFLPPDYQKDPLGEILAQWHSVPDFKLGETWPGGPPLYLSTTNGNWTVSRNWDSKQVTIPFHPGGKENINVGAYQRGVWTDWKFHIRWSAFSDGLIEIWKNDQLVLKKIGPNTYNDLRGPYFRIGIYKSGWKYAPDKSNTTQRVVYFDQINLVDNSTEASSKISD
jgi:hypothetical protein